MSASTTVVTAPRVLWEASPELRFRVGSLAEANPVLAARHYLGRIGAARLVLIGERNGEVVAAMVWRWPTARRLPADGTWLELSRWLLTPEAGENAGSRMHGFAARTIRRLYPGVTTLVSYSDPSVGHTGALYRACNWQWKPTWMRLKPPPSGGGSWNGERQEPKDRWVFELRPDLSRPEILSVKS